MRAKFKRLVGRAILFGSCAPEHAAQLQVSFANEAVFDLLTATWRTGTDLADDQERDALARLYALAAPLTRPAEGSEEGTAPGGCRAGAGWGRYGTDAGGLGCASAWAECRCSIEGARSLPNGIFVKPQWACSLSINVRSPSR